MMLNEYQQYFACEQFNTTTNTNMRKGNKKIKILDKLSRNTSRNKRTREKILTQKEERTESKQD